MSPFQTLLQEALPLLAVQPRDRILQIGCGDGWACRLLAPLLPEGLVIGLDLSDDAIREARVKSIAFENILYIWSGPEQIPWQEDFFTQALAVGMAGDAQVEEEAIRELFRVLIPGGILRLLNAAAPQDIADQSEPQSWRQQLDNDPRCAMLCRCGFESLEIHTLPRPEPDRPAMTAGRLLSARKPQR